VTGTPFEMLGAAGAACEGDACLVPAALGDPAHAGHVHATAEQSDHAVMARRLDEGVV
jgi:hypothetical protein